MLLGDAQVLATAIHDRAGIEIPARDYPRLATLNLFVSYLVSATSPPQAAHLRPGHEKY